MARAQFVEDVIDGEGERVGEQQQRGGTVDAATCVEAVDAPAVGRLLRG